MSFVYGRSFSGEAGYANDSGSVLSDMFVRPYAYLEGEGILPLAQWRVLLIYEMYALVVEMRFWLNFTNVFTSLVLVWTFGGR